jgi:hypothetical protein
MAWASRSSIKVGLAFQLDGGVDGLKRLRQPLPAVDVRHEQCSRVGLHPGQFRPGLRVGRIHAHCLHVGRDRGVQLAGGELRLAFQGIRVGVACGGGGRQEQRFDHPGLNLAHKPDAAQDEYHPQEHAVDIGLRTAPEDGAPDGYIHRICWEKKKEVPTTDERG